MGAQEFHDAVFCPIEKCEWAWRTVVPATYHPEMNTETRRALWSLAHVPEARNEVATHLHQAHSAGQMREELAGRALADGYSDEG